MKAAIDPLGHVPLRAHSYLIGEGPPQLDDSLWEQAGDGAVQTTPTELARFAQEYWEPRIGGPELLADRFAGAVADPHGEYGAGMFRQPGAGGTTVLQHSGAWASFRTGCATVPSERLGDGEL